VEADEVEGSNAATKASAARERNLARDQVARPEPWPGRQNDQSGGKDLMDDPPQGGVLG
jgi:hypothetical protein